jgi:hypothetical protein
MRFVNSPPPADGVNTPDGLAVASFAVAVVALAFNATDDIAVLAVVGFLAAVNMTVRGVVNWFRYGNTVYRKAIDEELG